MHAAELAHLFCIAVLVAVAAAFATQLWQSAALVLAGCALQELNSLLLHDPVLPGRSMPSEHLPHTLLVLGGVALGIELVRLLTRARRVAAANIATAHDEITAFCHHPSTQPQGEHP